MTLPIDFTGKTILVCGVHKGGIGGATCRQIAKAGGAVIALDKDQAIVDDIAEEVRALGGVIHTLVVNLLDVDQCEQVIPTVIDRFGPIDGVANVAGGSRANEWFPLDETPRESFLETLQLNFNYVFYLCRDAAKEWIRAERPGAIVNIASISAKDGAPWHGPYGAGKAGIIALTRTMANEWQEFGIRANVVSPGAVMTARVIAHAAGRAEEAKASGNTEASPPSGEPVIFCEPVQLANTITFLLSDLASGVSGQNLTVDRSLSTRFCGGARRSRKQMQQVR